MRSMICATLLAIYILKRRGVPHIRIMVESVHECTALQGIPNASLHWDSNCARIIRAPFNSSWGIVSSLLIDGSNTSLRGNNWGVNNTVGILHSKVYNTWVGAHSFQKRIKSQHRKWGTLHSTGGSSVTLTRKWSFEAFHSIPNILVYWSESDKTTVASIQIECPSKLRGHYNSIYATETHLYWTMSASLLEAGLLPEASQHLRGSRQCRMRSWPEWLHWDTGTQNQLYFAGHTMS